MAGLLLKNANFTTSFVNLGLVATMGWGLFTAWDHYPACRATFAGESEGGSASRVGDHILFRQVNSEHCFIFLFPKRITVGLGFTRLIQTVLIFLILGPSPNPKPKLFKKRVMMCFNSSNCEFY